MTPYGTLRYLDSDGPHAVVLEAASISIGRSPGQDLVLADHKVSRHHAIILRDGDASTLVDQNSTCGTFLNGERVQTAVLKHGDLLDFRLPTGMKVRYQDHAEDPADTPESTSLYGLLSFQQKSHSGVAEAPSGSARQMEQLNWLLRAARQLNQGGAIADILRALLQLTLQLTGVERGFVFLCEEKSLKFTLGLDAEGELLLDDSRLSRSAIEQAIGSESKFSISDTLADVRASEWSSVLANQIRSIYCIPLRTRGATEGSTQLLGLLYLDSQKRAGSLTSIDHELLDAIATESAALVHNALLAEAEQKARKAREELVVAARIHNGLMSTALPVLPYAQLNARTVPCLAIGGDFYDAVALGDSICLAIVDVSGKGVSAAIVAATLQGIIHAQLLALQNLADIAATVNHFLCARDVGKYATMVLVRLFPDGRIEYLNCGHIAPIAVSNGEVRTLRESNLIVGLIEGATYVSALDKLKPGERLFLATDGITEAEDAEGVPFGEKFNAIALDGDLLDILAAVAQYHAPEPAQDDCTLFEVRYLGATN